MPRGVDLLVGRRPRGFLEAEADRLEEGGLPGTELLSLIFEPATELPPSMRRETMAPPALLAGVLTFLPTFGAPSGRFVATSDRF